jgi:hypothetical protein
MARHSAQRIPRTCAQLESELASINELARTSRDNEEAVALVRQIDIKWGSENGAEVPSRTLNCAPHLANHTIRDHAPALAGN